jgi:glycosyltransferase involved in cell wall biosynthesis
MTKRQTHLLLSMYNDYSTLGLCINSVRDHVDSVIVADGAYAKYYGEYKKFVKDAKPYSTDGSIEILQAIPSIKGKLKFLENDHKPWENQCVKRTALLDAVPDGDWFIVLDSDELLHGDVDDALEVIKHSGCIAGVMPMYTPGLDAGGFYPMWHPIVFQKLPGMKYTRKHWNLQDEHNRIIEKSYPVQWTDRMVLVHLKVFRGGKRLYPHLSYMNMMSLDGWMEPMRRPQQFNIADQ